MQKGQSMVGLPFLCWVRSELRSTPVVVLITAVVGGLFRRRRALADHYLQIQFAVLAHQMDLRVGARLDLGDEVQKARRIGDVLAVHADQNVTWLDAGAVSRAV